jgi:hypothetical protein
MIAQVKPKELLLIAAVIGIVLSGLLSFVMLTPLGWGMSWQVRAPSFGAKLFFFAPLIALIVAGLARFLPRPSPSQEIALLAAPIYQAIYLAFSYLVLKPGA